MIRYIIDYENAHFCGGQLNVVVYANSKDEAVKLASYYMEETQRELFQEEIEEDGLDDECAYTVNSVEILDESHEYWEFYKDPSQASFYPEIGNE